MNTRHRVVRSYHRQQHFDFWSPYRNPFYSATVHFDVTRLKAYCDEHGHSIYVNLCYFFTRAMSEIEDFRYRLLDGRIVLYDELHPGLTVPAPDGLFTFAYFEYHPQAAVFNERAREISESARREVRLEDSKHLNWVYFTALPKVPFTSFTHATHQPTDTVPQVAFGKFSRQDGRLQVPAGIQVNHMLVDGNALGELVEGVQGCFDDPA